MFSATVLCISACLSLAPFSASQATLDDNPALQTYQNEEECFPLKETLYQLYQNFEDDPIFGGAGMCFRVTDTGPYIDGSTTATVQYSPDVSLDLILTLLPGPGYNVKNVVNIQSVSNPDVTFNFTVAYTDCDHCSIFRHSYTESVIADFPDVEIPYDGCRRGDGCSYWVPESKLGVKDPCCEFVYDLLCGTSPKIEVYYPDCHLGA